jgi:signal transduction histidine kinase
VPEPGKRAARPDGEFGRTMRNDGQVQRRTGMRWASFFARIRPYAGRSAFLLLCIVMLVAYAWYTRFVIKELQQDAIDVTQTYAELIRTAISENMDDGEMNVVFEEVIRKANNPIIVTDSTWRPVLWKNINTGPFYRREPVRIDDTTTATRLYLDNKIADFRRMFDPKVLSVDDGRLRIGYLVFGQSDLVTSLRWVPFLGVTVVAMFMIFAYVVFNTIRITERSSLWAGLAKETAHQLGTPISSLMGWTEYMKAVGEEEEKKSEAAAAYVRQVHGICDNMEHDLTRLRKITNRFSQVGSLPSLAPTDLNSVIEETKEYLTMRLPVLRRRIEIHTELGELPPVRINRDLIEWVFENLMKNSINAIRGDGGRIEIRTEYVEVDRVVRVSHADNGGGIPWKDRKKIFSPGYTTKKRGWGLGLTLAKRIVEDYHRGHIYLSRSQPGKETVFYVDLPATGPA